MEETKDITNFIQSKKIEVPSNEYFENLAYNILSQYVKPTSKVIPFYQKPVIKWLAAAAIITPCALYFLFQEPSGNPINVKMSLKEIRRADIHSYIMEN